MMMRRELWSGWIKEYKETDKKEKLWEELGEELGLQVGTN